MKIFVKAKSGAKHERIEKVDAAHFVVAVKAPPVDGKANAAILKALAKYFRVPLSNLRMVSGFASRQKVVEIMSG